jgi:N-acetyltransferase
MSWPAQVVLEGKFVKLEPLSSRHSSDLSAAAADGNLSALWYTAIPEPDKVDFEIERRLDLQHKGSMLAFAVVKEGKAVGMTTYMNIDAKVKRVEIGSTWYGKSVQRTPLNTECKLMLLTHAFEKLACVAVEFRTHFMNFQSREAIAKLGAKQDGILRNHTRTANGELRDTVVFSIIASEWPTVKAHLQYRLERLGTVSALGHSK